MSGIVFFNTRTLREIKDFYIRQVGCRLWMDQRDCVILKHDAFLLGFCQRETVDLQGCITFFYKTRDEVDAVYSKFKSLAKAPPVMNPNYPIYNFFSSDPEGRTIEFQYFTGSICEYLGGDELLLYRRSIREFKPDPVPDTLLIQVLDICRYAPTSMNRQSYYFKIVRDHEMLKWLAGTRGENSEPIGHAPTAVAICGDTGISKRPEQDACIAAYHFLLTAWYFGLGTCWIAAMDREDVKERLGLPKNHYIATVTPLGYPAIHRDHLPERKPLDWFLNRF